MEIFNIIVGISTIIGSICSFVSVAILHSINNEIKNYGNENVNTVSNNFGIKNTNISTTTISQNKEKF